MEENMLSSQSLQTPIPTFLRKLWFSVAPVYHLNNWNDPIGKLSQARYKSLPCVNIFRELSIDIHASKSNKLTSGNVLFG